MFKVSSAEFMNVPATRFPKQMNGYKRKSKEKQRTLDGSRTNVSDELGQSDGSLLHLLKLLGRSDADGSLLNDLLVSSLDGTVSTKEGDGIAVLIGEKLNLEMSSRAGKSHDEDRRTYDDEMRRTG